MQSSSEQFILELLISMILISTFFSGLTVRPIETASCTRAAGYVASSALAWNKTYGGTGSDFALALVQTVDGGCALAGRTYSFGAGSSDIWLVKTDASGNHLWNRTYGGTGEDRTSSLVQTVDGGYALAGTTYSFGAGSSDIWLVKTDESGNHLWNRTYGGIREDDPAHFVVQTVDGGYALAGRTYSFGAGSSDMWLIKTDAGGNRLWDRTYGGTSVDGVFAFVQTVDGGYALAGHTNSFGAGNYDFWLVKTDSAGNMVWNRTYGGTNEDWAYALIQTADEGYALIGETWSFGGGNSDVWLVRTDAFGNHLWNKTYGGTSVDGVFAFVQTVDGGYALAGHTNSFGAGSTDAWLVKTDAFGNHEWNETYGGIAEDYACRLIPTGNDSYVLAGSTQSFGAGSDDFWLFKTARGASTIIVPDDYSTIQEAVNNAVDGDNIFVKAGTYHEHVVVNKMLSLFGEDASTTTIDGDETGHVLEVVSDNVNITGFTIQRSGNLGYPVLDAGITVNGAKGCRISGNNVNDNGCLGIHLFNSVQNMVSGNNLTRNALFAIELTTSSDNIVSSNVAVSNQNIGIGMHASSNNNVISENFAVDNKYGIELNNAWNTTISSNSLVNNSEIGIWMQTSTVNSDVCRNNITGSRYGFFIEAQANDNIILQNNISMNDYGFYIESPTQNYIYHNNILNNTQQAYVTLDSINLWDNGYPSGGNYWSDYDGTDVDGDGIGDTPYVIDIYNVDRYPLMNPWIRLVGDINDDGTVDIFDAIQLANAFGTSTGHPMYNANADLNGSGMVDIFDAILLSNNFNKHVP